MTLSEELSVKIRALLASGDVWHPLSAAMRERTLLDLLEERHSAMQARLAEREAPSAAIAEMVDARLAERHKKVGLESWLGTSGELDDTITMLCTRLRALEDRLAEREQDLARLRREMDALRDALRYSIDDTVAPSDTGVYLAKVIKAAGEDGSCA